MFHDIQFQSNFSVAIWSDVLIATRTRDMMKSVGIYRLSTVGGCLTKMINMVQKEMCQVGFYLRIA